MIRTLFLTFFVALLTLGFATPAPSVAVHGGAVVGTVEDAHGRPVEHAIVHIGIRTNNGHHFLARTHTDRNGEFEFRTVPAGHGRVRAFHHRVGRGFARVTVQPGQTSRVHITLN